VDFVMAMKYWIFPDIIAIIRREDPEEFTRGMIFIIFALIVILKIIIELIIVIRWWDIIWC
jgi:hypothetical protein